jgi:GAF domain-containing protein
MGACGSRCAACAFPGAEGRAERLTGILRVVTERKREAQRLTYLATRDELTGHLNRTSLREELAQAIEAAKAEERNCAYLVASIDRLAMINEAYGFGASDEVIVAVGERLAVRCAAATSSGARPATSSASSSAIARARDRLVPNACAASCAAK